MDDIEEWRPWRNGDYEVSSHGRVRRVKPARGTFSGRILKPGNGTPGYLVVVLREDGRSVSRLVHHLVFEVYGGARHDGGLVLNHKDQNKHNNRADNLEVVTRSENAIQSYAHGTRPSTGRTGNAKLTWDIVDEIRSMRRGGATYSKISAVFGISGTYAREICIEKHWRQNERP